MSDRFYTSSKLAPGEFVFDGPEAHHLTTVRRFGPGDRLTLFNGDGHDYPAEVVSVGKKSALLIVSKPLAADRELGFPLIVGVALPKGDRADFLIEKLTELGATRFVPLVTERSVVRPKEDKVEKMERAVIEASKQCGRNVLMSVDPPRKWDDFFVQPDLPALKLVLHTAAAPAINTISTAEVHQGVAIAIGPEGGMTADEVTAAVAAEWRAVSLGKRVLRVETAAVAAAAWLAAV
ncbi:16S rRNA (uracil(1498)-N(3))-methyltransferase [Fimbriiglobus ruber]|uniref:Ribosomal RNA small subunit methyltransferase E n=1 Tax=Fimbriiglobus ruber TaxID=1908690 RepID=A0A225CYQ4_9BACT|nr:16S rRNA (uracil(1498)-N(3))-methyltransferase [Fimbriiglobus ruber]OWK34510.1 Ribosomal RNA small subunit methyltransferase E [Fimbriiglobus ruber]